MYSYHISNLCWSADVRSKKRKKSAKSRDYNSLLKYFFKDSCYFVMKSNNEENVLISKRESVWATPNSNEIKLNSAFNEFRNVILIFSVKESGKFQGKLEIFIICLKTNFVHMQVLLDFLHWPTTIPSR